MSNNNTIQQDGQTFDSVHWYDHDSDADDATPLTTPRGSLNYGTRRSNDAINFSTRLRTWNAPVRTAASYAYGQYGRLVTRCHLLFVLLGLLLSVFLMAGYFLRGEEVMDVRELWIPPNGWQKADQVYYESRWGRMTLEQVMITAKKFDEAGNEIPGAIGNLIEDHEALLQGLSLFQDILNITAIGTEEGQEDKSFVFEQVCAQPAAPMSLACLYYTPFDYWGRDAQKIRDDQDLGLTISELFAAGGLDGLQVPRENIFSGMVFEERPGGNITVKSAEAMMIWFFLDLSPSRTNYKDAYYNAVRDWERKMVKMAGEASFSRINVYRQADNSIDDEIERSLGRDQWAIMGSIGTMFFLFYFFILIERNRNWRVVAWAGGSVALSMGAIYGVAGWLELIGVTINYPGDGLMFFLLMVIGINHRHLLINRFCETPEALTPSERIAKICGEVLPSTSFQLFVTSFPMLVGSILTDLPGMKTYCYAGGIGMLVDQLNICTFLIGGMALYAKKQFGAQEELLKKVGKEEGLQDVWEGMDDEAWLPSFVPLSGGPRSWLWKAYQFLLSQSYAVKFFLYATVFSSAIACLGLGVHYYFHLEVQASRAQLSPIDSYLVDFGLLEEKYFARVPFPLDFAITNETDYKDPANGPKLFDLAAQIARNPYVNKTYAWYVDFTLHCRQAFNCPLKDGYPDRTAYDGELSHFMRFMIQNQDFFADVRLENDVSGDIVQHKFRGDVIHGGLYQYEDQRDGTNGFHELAVNSQAPVVPYASSFPYFHVWDPAERFLKLYYLPTCFGVVVALSFLILNPLVATVACANFFAVFFTVAGLGFAPFGYGFNLITAPLVLFLPPIIFDFNIHMAYRYSCMPGPRSTRKVERLLASFYPFSMVLSAVATSLGMLFFLLCLSAINLFFMEVFLAIVAASVLYSLLFFIGMLTLPLAWHYVVIMTGVAVVFFVAFLELRMM